VLFGSRRTADIMLAGSGNAEDWSEKPGRQVTDFGRTVL